MPQDKRPLFREYALQQYMQRKEKDTLPRIVAPPVFVCVWILFVFVITGMLLAWWQSVPTYAEGSGIVLTQPRAGNTSTQTATAVVFLPVVAIEQVRAGASSFVQINGQGEYISSSVLKNEAKVITPEDAQQQYGFSCGTSEVIAQPSAAVVVKFNVPTTNKIVEGSIVQARVQTGSKRVLSLLPGFSSLNGG